MLNMEKEWQRLGVVERHKEGVAKFEGHSAYQEAPEVIFRGTWWSYTPSLIGLALNKKSL